MAVSTFETHPISANEMDDRYKSEDLTDTIDENVHHGFSCSPSKSCKYEELELDLSFMLRDDKKLEF